VREANADESSGAARLDGRIIVVSGGTQGLGEATVRLIATRGAAGIVIVGRDRSKGAALAAELTTAATRCLFVNADMADADAPAAVMTAVDNAFGVVHGLVNIAAFTARGNVWDTDVELWDTMQDVNVRAPFFMIQGAAKLMRREAVSGSIVNIGSTSGHGGQPFILAYCVSKGALATLTKNAAYSLMRHNIRVNQVNPGWMDTAAEDAVQRRYHGATDGWLEAAEAEQPTGRLIKPPEVARSIVFLLSDESGMMTGTVIDYDQSVQGAGDARKPTLEETPQ
jgi:NAD(P)-dependent dehydrogenase (short-subunit alcohol dehydrogenase family)